jgi:hypothetical protein
MQQSLALSYPAIQAEGIFVFVIVAISILIFYQGKTMHFCESTMLLVHVQAWNFCTK